jgi:hypothetical protein
MSLTALPIEVQIVIAGHLAATSERPMDDLRSLRMTCLSMCRFYGDPTVGRRVALDRFKHRWEWNIHTNYITILANLTQVDNP